MRIVQLTPGAGGMFCGSCLRDNALVRELRRLGHDALMVPLYMPLQVDEEDTSAGAPVFFGGISVYLQQKSALFRQAPALLDRVLADPAVLRWAAGFSGQASPEVLGELTVSMLRGEDGRQAKELEKLAAWLKPQPRPDVISLSNALLLGMARRLKADLGAPVVCTLHGEDFFLDALPEPHRAEAWGVLRERAAEIDGFVAVSRYYGETMRARMGNLPAARFHAVHNGIDLNGYAPAPSAPEAPTVGYLSRFSPEKGLPTLVEAFARLKMRGRVPGARLKLAGSQGPADAAFVKELKRDLAARGLDADVSLHPNLTRAGKIAFLRTLSALSVPATYGEAFGLYVLEALACGVPVVQPEHGAFPELLAETGGGILCAADDPQALAEALEELLRNPARARELGEAGRRNVVLRFGVERMAREALEAYVRAGSSIQAAEARSHGERRNG
ncbi:MAG: glycosyltransferase family 4 protein [Planctomycetota bacterium]|nr:glycosyltransferase family 4 protein [Planctomycetota bacterium]